ncbi:hypothetical protein M413DRAFT_448578 [Hebeloma cylindrosporum]|uniref:Uncharacterized protein n=1 Tax=Hebeloma cylindrosporum TaxID=76867 RepID=A0A0C3BKN2_HEBCY|nr:hypothetical protein M413DRAFT_448578 [Hebeloma cylindrosporum h7]
MGEESHKTRTSGTRQITSVEPVNGGRTRLTTLCLTLFYFQIFRTERDGSALLNRDSTLVVQEKIRSLHARPWYSSKELGHRLLLAPGIKIRNPEKLQA